MRLGGVKSVPVMVVAAAVVALLLGWRLGSGRQVAETCTPESSPPIAVSTIAAAPRAVEAAAEVTGTVTAAQRAELAPKIMGRVTEVLVREGERVSRGQVLARIEAADLAAGVAQASAASSSAADALRAAQAKLSAAAEGPRAQEKAAADQAVRQAEAEARNAEANSQRYQRLYETGAISAMEVEAKRTEAEVAKARLETARQQSSLTHEGSRRQDVEAAKAQVAEARAQLGEAQAAAAAARVQYGYSQVVAPFSGIIVSRLADPGDLATTGRPLLVIEDTSLYRFEAQVPEESISRVQAGQRLPVVLDSLGRTLDGTVSRVLPSAEASSHTFTVKVDLAPVPGLKSGLFGRLRLVTGERQGLLIPEAAVLQRGQLSQVYAVENGHAVMRLVTLGERHSGEVEALSGVQAGDRIISPVSEQLHDGQAVQEAGR